MDNVSPLKTLIHVHYMFLFQNIQQIHLFTKWLYLAETQAGHMNRWCGQEVTASTTAYHKSFFNQEVPSVQPVLISSSIDLLPACSGNDE